MVRIAQGDLPKPCGQTFCWACVYTTWPPHTNRTINRTQGAPPQFLCHANRQLSTCSSIHGLDCHRPAQVNAENLVCLGEVCNTAEAFCTWARACSQLIPSLAIASKLHGGNCCTLFRQHVVVMAVNCFEGYLVDPVAFGSLAVLVNSLDAAASSRIAASADCHSWHRHAPVK